MIIGINELKTLTKHISCECKCRRNKMINVDVNVKNVMHVKKIMFIILLHVIAKMENI